MRQNSKIAFAAFAAIATVPGMGAGMGLATASPAMAHDHMAKKAEANIVETAMSTGMHETLVTAVKAADLADTLAGPGPFTVFAPTDDAFDELPPGIVDTLLEPANKDQLTAVLTYHAVPGKVTAGDLVALIEANGGMATITTVQGGTLTAMLEGGDVVITDGAGGKTKVVKADVTTSNGVIHVTDGVFLPN